MKPAERFIVLLIMIEDIFLSFVSLVSLVSLEIAHGLGVYSIIALFKITLTHEFLRCRAKRLLF